jgi:hypothetical protein
MDETLISGLFETIRVSATSLADILIFYSLFILKNIKIYKNIKYKIVVDTGCRSKN